MKEYFPRVLTANRVKTKPDDNEIWYDGPVINVKESR